MSTETHLKTTISLDVEKDFIIRTDAHCHILPGVDDGAAKLSDSIAMARRAAAEGIQQIVATPHGFHPSLPLAHDASQLRQAVAHLNQVFSENEIPVTVLPGMELYMSDRLPEMHEAGEVITWADQNRYILTELGFKCCSEATWDVLEYFLTRDITPIIAHPERYTWLPQQMHMIDELIEAGCWMQINTMSLAGHWGANIQDLAFSVIAKTDRWIVGTDAHRVADKYYDLERVRDNVRKRGFSLGTQ